MRFTYDFAHPELRLLAEEERKRDPNAAVITIKRSDVKPEWDLYSLGLTLLWAYEEAAEAGLGDDYPGRDKRTPSPKFYLDYLRLMGARLSCSGNLQNVRLPPKLLPERVRGRLTWADLEAMHYADSDDLWEDAKRACGTSRIENDIAELVPTPDGTIRLCGGTKVPLTSAAGLLVEAPVFRRLSQVTQLGLLVSVYPGASHTRFEHSLGTLAVGSKYLSSLYRSPDDPLFKSIMRESDYKAALVACLLHDLGQYPLAHDLEEVDELVFGHPRATIELLQHPDVAGQ